MVIVNIKILPAVCDGGQAGRTVGGAKRRDEGFDPEDCPASCRAEPLAAWRRYCSLNSVKVKWFIRQIIINMYLVRELLSTKVW